MKYDNDDFDSHVNDDLQLIDGAVKTLKGCAITVVLGLFIVAAVIVFNYWH
jgi:hypothetical protein